MVGMVVKTTGDGLGLGITTGIGVNVANEGVAGVLIIAGGISTVDVDGTEFGTDD